MPSRRRPVLPWQLQDALPPTPSRTRGASPVTTLYLALALPLRHSGDTLPTTLPPCVSRQLYDSTVDNVHAPTKFVAYHDAQAYPEYLLHFKRVRI